MAGREIKWAKTWFGSRYHALDPERKAVCNYWIDLAIVKGDMGITGPLEDQKCKTCLRILNKEGT